MPVQNTGRLTPVTATAIASLSSQETAGWRPVPAPSPREIAITEGARGQHHGGLETQHHLGEHLAPERDRSGPDRPAAPGPSTGSTAPPPAGRGRGRGVDAHVLAGGRAPSMIAAGSPGARRITPKTSSETPTRTGSASRMRRTR